jgi:hypothetical protein
LELSSRLLLLALVVVMKKSHENQLKGLLGVVGGEKAPEASEQGRNERHGGRP